MNKTKHNFLKWSMVSVLILLITAGIAGYTLYNKPHRNVKAATAISLHAQKLVDNYEQNENTANKQFLDKVLEVTGQVNEISKNQKGETIIELRGSDMASVRCTLEDKNLPNVKSGELATLKGICTGYLTDVVMVRCVLASN